MLTYHTFNFLGVMILMGMSIASVQNLLELYLAGLLNEKKSVVEFGSQELHLKSKDLEELLLMANIDFDISNFPNLGNWPNQPRCSTKYLYKILGLDESTRPRRNFRARCRTRL